MAGTKQTARPQKRKAENDGEKPVTKKPKQPKNPKAKDAALDIETGINSDFAHMNPDILADHLSQQTKRFQDDLSLVELDEMRVPVAAIRDTTDFEHERTLQHLPAFLRKYSSPRRAAANLSKAPKGKGSPHTIVVTGAGLRSANVRRALNEFQTKDLQIAKLFAKHIKFEEAKELVEKTKFGIGVGTPKRLSDLFEDGALSSADLERVVIDVSHIDQKKRGILDMKELQPPLMDLLNRAQLKDRYGAENDAIELLFY